MSKEAKEHLLAQVKKSLSKLDEYEPNSNARIGLENATKVASMGEAKAEGKSKKSKKQKKEDKAAEVEAAQA